jgi:SAM-dependent methyltransferase
VGCGTGHFTEWLAHSSPAVVGVDASPGMLEAFHAKGTAVPLLRADAHALPFADRAFDVVTLITTLEFLDDPPRALAEAARVARRGLVLLVFNRWSLGALSRRRGTSRYRGRARDYSIRELLALVRGSVGPRFRSTRWLSTLFPGAVSSAVLPVPAGGAVLGVAVELEAE